MVLDASGSPRLHALQGYTSYGEPMVTLAADFDQDGDVDFGDFGLFVGAFDGLYGAPNYDERADFDRDGDVDFGDFGLIALEDGETQRASTSLIPLAHGRGYAGYVSDPTGSSRYFVRHRVYDAKRSVWSRRDPIGYVDGMNRYQYVSASPVVSADPSGLTPLLWTASGINNWTGDRFRDYVAEELGLDPQVSYKSRIGTKDPYRRGGLAEISGGVYGKKINSEAILDGEAYSTATNSESGKFCPPSGGCASDSKPKKIIVFLIAPKTSTVPNIDSECCDVQVNVYFSPWDAVPNQEIDWDHLLPRNNNQYSRFWQKIALNGFVQAVNTRVTPGYRPQGKYPNHHIRAFMSSTGTLRNAPGYYRIPDASAQVRSFMSQDVDYVWVGHSQGTNILLHLLNHLCNRDGIDRYADGAPK